MNPFAIIFRSTFVMLEASWQIVLMLVEFVLLAFALVKVFIAFVLLVGRVVRNAYRRWF